MFYKGDLVDYENAINGFIHIPRSMDKFPITDTMAPFAMLIPIDYIQSGVYGSYMTDYNSYLFFRHKRRLKREEVKGFSDSDLRQIAEKNSKKKNNNEFYEGMKELADKDPEFKKQLLELG